MEIVGYILVGVVAGGLAATLGIGGGVVYVPALVTFFTFSQHAAQGTSLAIIVPTTIIATIGHGKARRILPKLAIALAAAGVVGAIVGAKTALVIDEDVLRRIFAIILIVITARMGLRTRLLYRLRAVDRS
jgi:hypothetical protein